MHVRSASSASGVNNHMVGPVMHMISPLLEFIKKTTVPTSPMPLCRNLQPSLHSRPSGRVEQFRARVADCSSPLPPSQWNALKAMRFEDVKAPQQHAGAASSSAAKPVRREAPTLPFPKRFKHMCSMCKRVDDSTSMSPWRDLL